MVLFYSSRQHDHLALYLTLQAVRCMNQIEEVCKDIEKTISQTVQNTLNTLEHDCELLANEAQQRISADK